MGFKKKGNWRDGQTPAGMDASGKARDKAGNNPKPKSVRFSPAQDGDGKPAGYTAETEYDNSGTDSYTSPTTSVHADEGDASSYLSKAFDRIDGDNSLDPAEKRRKKAKASLQAGKSKS